MSKKEPKLNPSRQVLYARRKRDELIKLMGGACALCGSVFDLEFDHEKGRDYDVRKLSYSARLKRYEREWREGKLRLLCQDCNLRTRATTENGSPIVATRDRDKVARTNHMDFANEDQYSPNQVNWT